MALQPPSLPLYEDDTDFDKLYETSLPSEEGSPGPSIKPSAMGITATTTYSPAIMGQIQQKTQSLGLGLPIWNITTEPGTESGPQRFLGSVTVATGTNQEVTVSLDEPGTGWGGYGLPSKKDVKAALATKLLPLLEGLQSVKNGSSGAGVITQSVSRGDEDGINWIGKILEYSNSIPVQYRYMTYHESTTMPASGSGPNLFSCLLDLAFPTSALLGVEGFPSCPYTNLTFPAPSEDHFDLIRFPSKRAAKIHCSRLAGQKLVSLGLLLADGNLPPKQQQLLTTKSSPTKSIPGLTSTTGPSVLCTIPRLTEELGLGVVSYEFTSPSGDPNNAFVDCAASFKNVPQLPDPLVVVRNVFGKKKAKEECARRLLEALGKVRAWRLQGSGPWMEGPGS